MSENETPKKPETKEACEEAGGTWNAETGTCTMPKAEPEQKALLDRMMGVMEDFTKARLDEFKKDMDKKIEDVIKAKEVEFEQALRKGFGLTKDTPLTTSDIPNLLGQFRKAALENQENRSPTGDPLEKGNPDGTAKKDSFDEAVERKFKEMS